MNKAMVPNLFTLSNCLFGILSIIASAGHRYTLAALFIAAAVVADALDGRVARFFGVASEMGKELDSLCDAVSFGAAPAILIFQYSLQHWCWYGALLAAVYALCGVWRLARFNVSTAVIKGYFQGMPIPGGGIAIAAYVFSGYALNNYAVACYTLLMGFLMVSSIKYPDFKGKSTHFGKAAWVVAVLVAAAILFFSCTLDIGKIFFALVMLFITYGMVNAVLRRKAS